MSKVTRIKRMLRTKKYWYLEEVDSILDEMMTCIESGGKYARRMERLVPAVNTIHWKLYDDYCMRMRDRYPDTSYGSIFAAYARV